MLPSMAETLGPLYSCKRGVLWRWWRNLTSKVSTFFTSIVLELLAIPLYSGLHAKYLTFLSDLTNSEFSWQSVVKVCNVNFQGNPSSRSRADTCGRTDGQRDEAYRCCTQLLWSRTTRCLLESHGSLLFIKALEISYLESYKQTCRPDVHRIFANVTGVYSPLFHVQMWCY